MFRPRASRLSVRAALAVVLLLTTVAPVSGGSPTIRVETTATPTSVTVGHAIGYVVNVSNDGGNTVNHITLTGEMQNLDGTPTGLFTYLGAYTGDVPNSLCSQTTASCSFDQLAAGTAAPDVTFYYLAPAAAGTFDFVPTARVGEGGNDNDNASHVDTFPDPPVRILTEVLAVSDDLARGHSIGGFRTFTTGLGALGTGNPHGTTVQIPTALREVTVKDLDPNVAENASLLACPAAIASSCFGWGSSLDVGDGTEVPGGIKVTMRWDSSQLPNGMTARKLRVAHLLGDGTFEQVTGTCVFDANGPTNAPCFTVPPFKHTDKDIEATFFLDSNRVSRGY